ncbi:hypothetical protein PSPTOT1_4165 [Pseudomonas syringae pv. tomato T1]|nr:hypothetical protein PSPTOT1_4165 [Pseudomonas syringae pv. tomato T1]RMQ64404.1 hypothetical protein ALQ00_200274 [Pseudomonas syringae pv. tomato]
MCNGYGHGMALCCSNYTLTLWHQSQQGLCMTISKNQKEGFSNPGKTKGPFNNRMTLGPAEREIVASPRGLEPLLPP